MIRFLAAIPIVGLVGFAIYVAETTLETLMLAAVVGCLLLGD